MSSWRAASKRSFDLLASALLLAIAWPVMLLAALLNKLEALDQPIFYRQTRMGFNGKEFDAEAYDAGYPAHMAKTIY